MIADQGIEVQCASGDQSLPDAASLRRWAMAALPAEMQSPGLVIRVVDEDESLALNNQYRGKDKRYECVVVPV